MKKKKTGILKPSDLLTPEFFENWYTMSKLEEEWDKSTTIHQRWGIIRQIYAEMREEILEASAEDVWAMVDPYPVDWSKQFTPIEYDAWCSIRGMGLPFYPQYPVFSYFIDFANPFLKVAVEVDGKDWHDEAKDRKRDERLAEHGWHTYRIPGRECHAAGRELEEIRLHHVEYGTPETEVQREYEDYFCTTSDGVFKAIEIIYFRNGESPHATIAARSLNQHRLAQFEIGPRDYI